MVLLGIGGWPVFNWRRARRNAAYVLMRLYLVGYVAPRIYAAVVTSVRIWPW